MKLDPLIDDWKPSDQSKVWENEIDHVQEGDRVWDSVLGKASLITAIYQNDVQIHYIYVNYSEYTLEAFIARFLPIPNDIDARLVHVGTQIIDAVSKAPATVIRVDHSKPISNLRGSVWVKYDKAEHGRYSQLDMTEFRRRFKFK